MTAEGCEMSGGFATLMMDRDFGGCVVALAYGFRVDVACDGPTLRLAISRAASTLVDDRRSVGLTRLSLDLSLYDVAGTSIAAGGLILEDSLGEMLSAEVTRVSRVGEVYSLDLQGVRAPGEAAARFKLFVSVAGAYHVTTAPEIAVHDAPIALDPRGIEQPMEFADRG